MKLRHWLMVIAAAAVTACSQGVPGPQPPDPGDLSAVRVTPIAPAEGEPYEIREGAASVASSGALSEYGWVAARGRPLEPLYKLDLLDGSEILAVYWLGTNSHPPRFPCYALCSGWWVGSSTAAGGLDATRYKGLVSAQYFDLLSNLEMW